MEAKKQVSCNLLTPTQNLALQEECLKTLIPPPSSSFCNIPTITISTRCQLSNTTLRQPHHLDSSCSLLSEDSSSNSSYTTEASLTFLISNSRNDHLIQNLSSRLPWELPAQSRISLKFFLWIKETTAKQNGVRMLREQAGDCRQLLGIPMHCGKGVAVTATGLRTP